MAALKEQAYDAIVVGAGISGLYQLYRLRELGLRVLVLDYVAEKFDLRRDILFRSRVSAAHLKPNVFLTPLPIAVGSGPRTSLHRKAPSLHRHTAPRQL